MPKSKSHEGERQHALEVRVLMRARRFSRAKAEAFLEAFDNPDGKPRKKRRLNPLPPLEPITKINLAEDDDIPF